MKSIHTEAYQQAIQALIDARNDSRLTQQELAKRLNRPQSFVAKYEGLERRLDITEYIAIANVVNLDVLAVVRRLQDKLNK